MIPSQWQARMAAKENKSKRGSKAEPDAPNDANVSDTHALAADAAGSSVAPPAGAGAGEGGEGSGARGQDGQALADGSVQEDVQPDFEGKIQLEGAQVLRWVDMNTSGKVLLGFKWMWERNDATDAQLSVHIGAGVFLPPMDPGPNPCNASARQCLVK